MKKDRKKLNIGPWIHKTIVASIAITALVAELIRTLILKSAPSVLDYIFFIIGIITIIDLTLSSIKAALKDVQSGMPNDNAMIAFAIIQTIRKRLFRYTAVFINLKGFKLVNRIAGSIGGDKALSEYSKILNSTIKKGEYAARFGGDNYMVLIYHENLDAFLKCMREVPVQIQVDGKDYSFKIGSRFGLYQAKKEDDVGKLFNAATSALNFAKASAQDYVWFDEKLSDTLLHEKEISSCFSDSLNNDEFIIVYQPKVDVKTDTLNGAEALVRWQRGSDLLSPNVFIPALEHSGYIRDLDLYVLAKVCDYIKKRSDEGLPCVKVSVNFSALNLQTPAFADRVIETIKNSGVSPDLIEIELTETSSTGSFEVLSQFFARLKQEGITTAIDDYGVGYSSMELLQNVSIDVVKVDKRFIDNVADNNGNNPSAVLLKHILSVCNELGKSVVCEGVESIVQRSVLVSLGCPTIQGYLYDRPLTREDFEAKLENPKYRY